MIGFVLVVLVISVVAYALAVGAEVASAKRRSPAPPPREWIEGDE